MDHEQSNADSGDRAGIHVTISSALEDNPSTHHRHSALSSGLDTIPTIPESEEANFQDSSYTQNVEGSLLRDQQHAQPVHSPSLFRKITTKLASPRFSSSSVRHSAAIPLNSLKSIRKSRGPDYENLQDNDEAEAEANVPVDLSSLSGLGFQLTEEVQAPTSQHWLDQDTTYQSPQSATPKPDFQSFLNRRIGDGLVVGAQLRRDPSSAINSRSSRAEQIQRTKTARNAAQNIAKERNIIVAVSEPVDLSFLEGRHVPNRVSRSFDTMINSRGGSVENDPKSYFFPRDSDIPDWRPATMRKIFIIFLSLLAFALAGTQEYLCQESFKRQKEKRGLLSFNEVANVSVGAFFVWKYLPTMITIIYAVIFAAMDFDIRRLEPYYQLSQPKGSPASSSLNVDHLTMFQYFVPFKALRLRQWTVFFSTIGNIIASTVSPALQNPSVNFTVNPACDNTDPNNIKCPDGVLKYVVLIDPIWSRLLTASYIVIAIITVILFIQLQRKSGLLSDPKGIAGIASMATKSHILHDFKGTDLATRKDIQKRLAHRRFVLYQSSIWQGEWNINNVEPEGDSDRSLESPHPPMLRLTAGVPFVSAQVFCLIAVPLIALTPANIIPNAAPWLPILIATILKLVWSTFESDIRLMEPFYQLSLGNQPPENSLTLDYQATLYGFMPFKAAYNGHWLLCIVGICSVSLDVLSVTVSSFSVQASLFWKTGKSGAPDNQGSTTGVGDETKVSFWASVILSLVILTFSIATTILVYVRRRHPFLPREPSTIAAVLGFIYASNMLEDFIDTERLTNKQMEERLKKLGKRYGLGWFKGRDGQVHCAIDQEPMRSKYVHGKPYHQALAGPITAHEEFYV